jgi:hypothetical protein
MISVPTGVRVWLATGHTDMRKALAVFARGGRRAARSSFCAIADGAPISASTTASSAPSSGLGGARRTSSRFDRDAAKRQCSGG